MLPPLAVLDKMAGGAVSRFRGATLDGARRNAALFGYAGAMFGVLPTGQRSLTIPVSALTTRLTSWTTHTQHKIVVCPNAHQNASRDSTFLIWHLPHMAAWESSPRDGHGATLAPTGWSEQHVSLDVASGVWAAALVLDETDYYREVAYPLLRDVSDWLISRGTFSARGFEVRAMGGPDESIAKVDNNLYFNALAMRVLRAAIDCAALLPGLASPRKLTLWQRALELFVVPTTTDGGATVAKPFDQAPTTYRVTRNAQRAPRPRTTRTTHPALPRTPHTAHRTPHTAHRTPHTAHRPLLGTHF